VKGKEKGGRDSNGRGKRGETTKDAKLSEQEATLLQTLVDNNVLNGIKHNANMAFISGACDMSVDALVSILIQLVELLGDEIVGIMHAAIST
jgi:hypothetical protein